MEQVERSNAQAYMNQALFADHYLRERMADHPEWREDMSPLFDRLKNLYVERLPRLENANEAQTEDEFIKPALELLGFEYIPQIKYKRAGQTNRPDYALFPDANTKDDAYPLQDDQAKFFSRTLAICEAKYWGRPLDRQTDEPGRDQFENAIPGFQIVNYLIGTEVDWGILTNGKLWRLYYQRARSRTTTYYEVDLEGILSRDDTEAFRYFYHFFNRRAFSEVDHTGKTLLERVYEGSITHAERLGRDLKALVFEEIFIHLAEGFMEYRRERLGMAKETEQGLREIFSATLRLLYRLLFILYAEARDLLPVSERLGYYKYSLTKLKQEIAQDIMRGERLSRVSDNYWNDLAGLFRIIDRGDPSINVPTYNGGLFRQDHPKNAFLNQHRISDFYSAKALDLLTREQGVDSLEPRFIDYRDLGVRELGSIYEGLLEFYLRIAQEDLIVVKAKGREVYVPLKEAKGRGNGRIIKEGELYLENDKHERKATGTYYTPDYIVKYIVKNTVGPVLEERTKAFEHWMEEAAEARKGLRRLRSPASIRTAREELKRLEMLSVNALLDVKILDPAMGSGHFLVEAVDQLTDGIVSVLASYPDNPVLREIERIRRNIRDNLEKQGIEVKEERLSDDKILKRMVMKRCVYGVDLNEMAVELAKLSLWLNSFTMGAPLSFLDHHLKTGNSLIGARVGEVREAVEAEAVGTGAKDDREKVQTFLLGSRFAGLLNATQLMLEVGELTDATFAEVERSASLYEDAEKNLRPYKRLLDLWTSEYFGNKEAQNYLRLYGDVDVFVKGDLESIPKAYRKVVRRGGEIAEEKRFFHWELEFPEVFYKDGKRRENPGFDAVVGNPPYDVLKRVEGEDERNKEIDFYRNYPAYKPAMGIVLNVFRLFLVRGLQLGAGNCALGQIIPLTFMSDVSASKLRVLLVDNIQLGLLECFPQKDDPKNRVFEDAKLSTMILHGRKGVATTSIRCRVHPGKLIVQDSPLMELPISSIGRFDPENLTIPVATPDDVEVLERIYLSRLCIPMSQVAQVAVGEIDMTLDADCRTDDPSGSTAPLLKGAQIQRYELRERPKQGKLEWVDLDVYREKYQASVKLHVSQYRRVVFQGVTGTDDARRLTACLAPAGFFLANSVNYIAPIESDLDPLFLLALINSQLLEWRFRLTSTNNNINNYEVDSLPFRLLESTTPSRRRRQLAEKGRKLYEGCLFEGHAPMLEFVDHHLEAGEANVIHDLLAYLAKQIIEMNTEKQAEAKTFLNWLTDYSDLPINEWHLKTYVREYWVQGWDELKRALRRNASRFGRDMESPKHQTRIKKGFEESLSRLEPILARIQATDRLIDLIVYRLYGLTEEEVAIVEGTVAR